MRSPLILSCCYVFCQSSLQVALVAGSAPYLSPVQNFHAPQTYESYRKTNELRGERCS